MKSISAFLILLFTTSLSLADCMMIPPQTCVEIQLTQVLSKGQQGNCLAKVAIKGKQPRDISVYFDSCPGADQSLRGDLKQRADITVENMAACQYEFKPNKVCSKKIKSP